MKKVKRGKLSSNKSSLAISVARTLSRKVWRKRLIRAVIKPTANPPTMEMANEVPAWVSENVPVVQAMRAIRKATSPEASFRRPSPFRILETRFGKEKR